MYNNHKITLFQELLTCLFPSMTYKFFKAYLLKYISYEIAISKSSKHKYKNSFKMAAQVKGQVKQKRMSGVLYCSLVTIYHSVNDILNRGHE